MWASSFKTRSIEFLNEIHKDTNGIGASSSKALSIEFLKKSMMNLMELGPPINKDSHGTFASSSEALSIEFLTEINQDYNGIGASHQ
jgi:hypothetical protein